MPYLNADSCIPPELLHELQKYVQGQIVYIPRPQEQRLGWGIKSGSRTRLEERNQTIRILKQQGHTIDDLADQFCISPDAIKKVLYRKKLPMQELQSQPA